MDVEAISEVIIASSNECVIHDANNANEIASYKDDISFAPKTLSLIGDDFLIGAHSNKPMLKVWTISKLRKQEVGSFVVPGLVSALSVSNCGNYCVAGIKDQIFVWEVSTGELLMVLNRHYQSVTCLKFTDDDSRFFSGGKDGHVLVWILSCVIDVSGRPDTIKPHFVWNNHSTEITDIYCGNSVSRVATTSLDMTCKIYELDSGLLLSSICMDMPLTAVVMDTLEYYIYLGDDRGYLYRINTYEKLPHEIHRADVNNKAALKLHDAKIISLSVNFAGTRLMTASEDKTCKLWDIHSMACVLNIRFEGALTNAFLAMKPACLSNKTLYPQLRIQIFHKDISLTHDAKKFIEKKSEGKQLSLMYDGCPDKNYSKSFLYQGIRTPIEDINPATINDIFSDAIHGESIAYVTQLNQQLFTAAINKDLHNAFGRPPSPT